MRITKTLMISVQRYNVKLWYIVRAKKLITEVQSYCVIEYQIPLLQEKVLVWLLKKRINHLSSLSHHVGLNLEVSNNDKLPTITMARSGAFVRKDDGIWSLLQWLSGIELVNLGRKSTGSHVTRDVAIVVLCPLIGACAEQLFTMVTVRMRSWSIFIKWCLPLFPWSQSWIIFEKFHPLSCSKWLWALL